MERTRYRAIERAIDEVKPKRILEVGVQHGFGAKMMIERALRYRREVAYCGFDLFRFASVQEVYAKLDMPGASIALYPGNSLVTLPSADLDPFDLIYLDGDHSFTGQLIDWCNVQRFVRSDSVIMIDDYADAHDWGSKALVEGLREDHDVEISDEVDKTAGSGRFVRMATVRRQQQ